MLKDRGHVTGERKSSLWGAAALLNNESEEAM